MDANRSLTAERSILGSCPNCTAAIPEYRVLIEYETSEGWPRTFAECPDCESVVHPR